MKKILFILLLLSLSINSYAGERRSFPEGDTLPFLGLDDTSCPIKVKDGRAADLQNVTLDIDGTARKRYGSSLKNATLDTSSPDDVWEAVTGGYEFVKSDNTRYFLVNCGNKLFYDVSGSWTNITGSVTITEGQNYQWSWITALDYAIGTNGTDPPIKWNSSGNASTVNFTGLTSTINRAKCATWWKNYLIWGNTSEAGIIYPTRIRWSNVGTIQTYSNDDFVDIATLGGQEITGFGILYDNLIIFLTDSIYKVSLVGGDELIVISKVSEGIGCIAKNSIQNVLIGNIEALIFLSKDGTIYQFDGARVTEISTLIRKTLSTLNNARLQYAVSADDANNSHYYLCLTDTNQATTNNLLLDFYYEVGEWSKHTGIKANSMWVANDSNSMPQVYFGNYKAFCYQLNNENKLSDVYGFTGIFDNSNPTAISTATGMTILYDSSFSFYDILLLHGEGIDGSINIIDEAEHIVTAYGNTQIDTAQYKFTAGSILFDGTGDYCTLVDSADWDFGSGDFTIDVWVRFSNVDVGTQVLVNHGGFLTTATAGWVVWFGGAANVLAFADNDAGTFYYTSSWDPVINTWYHVAVVRNGNVFTSYIDGVSIGSQTQAGALTDSARALSIGVDWENTGYFFNGWIDEPRISKGIARWTSNFTPRTTPYDNSNLASIMRGATLRIISGTGKDEESVICSSTTTGIIVTNDTTAIASSEYTIGKIDSFYTTKWYSMGLPYLRKNFTDLYLWTTKKPTDTLKIYYAGDEVSTIENASLDDYSVDSLWGSKIVSGLTAAWSGDELSFSRIPLNISGRFTKTKFEDSNIDSSMHLHSYNYIYENLDIY